MKSKRCILIALLLAGLCVILLDARNSHANTQQRIHTVYFEDTDYELHVYRIHGEEPGKTLMIIGGIQGDEPVGYLAADLFVDFFLARGNLIVVPRANFQSIMLNRRQINEDMNRKFADDKKENYETKVVGILKQLIGESDCLLNLHEGSGFYSETWEDPYRNPMRYGQSIIADAETCTIPDKGVSLNLGEMARAVIDRMNPQIQNPDHHFRFNNHRTDAMDSMHKEQRKSATYYALYTCGIPAFGIEASKSLPLETKIRHHKIAIKAFMDMMEILPETPGVTLDPPQIQYAVISINDEPPVLVPDQQTLFIKPGDAVAVSHVEANYERGLSADIIDYGTINDLRKRLVINKPTNIVFRKDYYPCGSIYLAMNDDSSKAVCPASMPEEDHAHDDPLFFNLRINDEEKLFRNNEHASLIRGDRLQILDVACGNRKSSELVVNFKGFVGNAADNTGEDRGYIIDTGGDLLNRYSVNRDGKTYPVVVTDNGKLLGNLFIEMDDPIVKYAVLRLGGEEKRCYRTGESVELRPDQTLEFVDLITNVQDNRGVETIIKGPENMEKIIKLNDMLDLWQANGKNSQNGGSRFQIEFRRNRIPMGSLSLILKSGEIHE